MSMSTKIKQITAAQDRVIIEFAEKLRGTDRDLAVKPACYELTRFDGALVELRTIEIRGNDVMLIPKAPLRPNDRLSVKVHGLLGIDDHSQDIQVVGSGGGNGHPGNGHHGNGHGHGGNGGSLPGDLRREDIHALTRAMQDAVVFPNLVRNVDAFPVASGRAESGGTSALGQAVTQAINDVLGWKARTNDPKGVMGALNASFTVEEVDGHTEWKWTPRTYAVQTDLAGGITGAQASLYTRAREALQNSLPLLEGLYPLDADPDAEDVDATRALVKSQFASLVEELGAAGGPRVVRIDQYFQLLLGQELAKESPVVTDPDEIGGSLGQLRDVFGLCFSESSLVNTVAEEQNLSNFRILADYVISLAYNWVSNREFFKPDSGKRFYGTQLVLLSRQLSVIAESVDEVRSAFDSVFIGQADRETLQLKFRNDREPMFVEDLLSWVQSFATTEGPRLIEDGGKLGVEKSFKPIAQQLTELVRDARTFNDGLTSRGFHSARVRNAFKELEDQLAELTDLCGSITRTLPATVRKELLGARVVAVPAIVNFNKANTHVVTLINIGGASATDLIVSADHGFSVQDPPTELKAGSSTLLTIRAGTGKGTLTAAGRGLSTPLQIALDAG